MWWQDLFWGFWNGLSAWVVFIVHIFGGWPEYPVYDIVKSGNWYDLGFLIGASSPILGGSSTNWSRRKVYNRGKGKAISQDENTYS